MEIRSIQASNAIASQTDDNQLAELEQLWDAWYNNPNQQTGQSLLTFLKDNESYFEQEAQGKNPPSGFPPNTPFSHYYETAINSLQNWLNAGCNPNQITPVSEWVGDIVAWLNQK